MMNSLRSRLFGTPHVEWDDLAIGMRVWVHTSGLKNLGLYEQASPWIRVEVLKFHKPDLMSLRIVFPHYRTKAGDPMVVEFNVEAEHWADLHSLVNDPLGRN